jgi:dienelactone hydrolase
MRRFPTETCPERAQRLLEHATVVRPDRAGPMPLMVLLHGCGSARGPQESYVAALVAVGIACVIVDSYAPRQISRTEAVTRVCSGTMLWGRERAGDFVALLAWARGQDWVDATRLGGLGWSHGGWTIMDALALGKEVGRRADLTDLDDDPLAGLAHVSLIYPWCGPGTHTFLRGWAKAIDGAMILASRDSVAGTRLPKLALNRARRSGAQIDLHEIAGATHSFDEQNSLNPTFHYQADQAGFAIDTVTARALRDFKLQAAGHQ